MTNPHGQTKPPPSGSMLDRGGSFSCSVLCFSLLTQKRDADFELIGFVDTQLSVNDFTGLEGFVSIGRTQYYAESGRS